MALDKPLDTIEEADLKALENAANSVSSTQVFCRLA